MTDAFIIALILSPAVLTFLLKSNAALSFLALCAGFVLSTSVIGDLRQLLSEMNLSVTNSTLAITLITLPLVFTLLLTRKTNTRGFKLWIQLLAALLAGGLLALSVAPVINATWLDLSGSNVWQNLIKAQSGVIGAGAFLNLLLVWLGGSKLHGKKHK
ncbi:MAG TPA: hypothetical protein VI336_00890 [Candidatus Saccharimonadales bacterium]|nr:hypothetical protein [Candidatus Saccharimonadales bacterium]